MIVVQVRIRKLHTNCVLDGGMIFLKRNYGIDLLKVIAMHMVLVLHVLGIGGGKTKKYYH